MIRRKSVQRERIFEVIKNSQNHPTAIDIYDDLRKENPSISLGNVYRNIKILVEERRIISRKFGDNIEHYDSIVKFHYHFICENCQEISDFNFPVQNKITRQAQGKTGHNITGHTINFYGLCEKCKKNKKGGKYE